MFFRRVFSRKSSSSVDSDHRIIPNQNHDNNNADASNITVPISPHRLQRKQIKLNEGFSVLQLTPLWEHIIRTKSLPSNINETEMFLEFMERLYDPEWQVRQHALKVLVDVLIVMGQRTDQYFSPLIKPLVENLGHGAPAVQKGALDCLKVYMSETAMPETVLLEIIGVGMEQKMTNSAAFGRQCIAVMLSLPSLIQTQLLNKLKRSFVIKAAIDALTVKMTQVTYQETALKVLLRIRQMIGSREFAEHIPHGEHREFELLCNVYGLPDYLPTRDSRNDLYDPSDSIKYSAWQVLSADFITNSNMRPSEVCWKSTTEDEADESDMSTVDPIAKSMFLRKANSCPNVFPHSESSEKVIMETEINIENTPVTMRILEEKSYEDELLDDNNACRTSVYEHSGIIRVLTDSELDEMNGEYYTRGRTPRRVTFGGESIKVRTPDSDSVVQSDSDAKSRSISLESSTVSVADILHIDIPIDNTKELSPERSKSAVTTRSDSISPNAVSTTERAKSARHRRFSPSNSIVSPILPHKQIEVLHNLQRSPLISPERNRRSSSAGDEKIRADENTLNEREPVSQAASPQETDKTGVLEQKRGWEDLGLIDADGITNLKSGDWRLRSSAICQIEDALKSTENLALVQPHLDSLLRTLLSADDKNVLEDKCRVLVNLISRLPLDNLEDRTDQIIVGLCRQGGAGSNHIAKSLLQRLPPTVVVHKLLSDEFLNTRSARFRENALQIVLFALMTFPSTCFDIPMCVSRACAAAIDRKRRVRQAALDVLAVLGQISSPKTVLDIVHQNSANREDGERLLSAVKARLARKQLPIIGPNGSVQYALRIPSPDANAVMYLFGADIEWINAGVGYVSPLAMKRHSSRLQQPHKYLGYDKNGAVEDTITKQQRHKAPHEILAVGVGVKPPYDYNSNVIGGYTKVTTSTDDDKSTHFVIATSVPSNSVPINFNGTNKVKFQAKPFPEQLNATLGDNRDTMRQYVDSYNGNKPSKLPVTSRFPAMENHYEARQGRATIKNHSFSNGYALKNGSNRYVYTNSSSQESPSDQSSNDEYRSYTYSTTSPPNRQRFANVNKYLSKKSSDHIKTEDAAFTRVQQISTVSSPSIDRTSSTVLLGSAGDAEDRIVYEYSSVGDLISNENRFSAHSKSSSKRSMDDNKSNASVHSNSPSKKSVKENVLDTSSQVTVVAVDEKTENVVSASRPISVSSMATTKSLYDEYEDRPATSLAKSNASSASTTGLRENNRSRTSFLADEVDRPISVTSRPASHVGEIHQENDQNSDDEKPVEQENREIDVEIVEKHEERHEERDVETVQCEGADEKGEEVTVADTRDHAEMTAEVTAVNAEITATDAPAVSSDSESNFTTDVVDEVDFVKERSDEQTTTTSTVSSIQNFTSRPPVRFRKRKVSPTKPPPQLSSRPKLKDQHILCLQQLDSTNWDQIMLGLQSFVCLMRNNPDQIEPQLHQYCLALSKNIKNLRSQVSRASCQAAAEFFESHSKLLEQESDDLAMALLNRTADTNKFLRSDATKALKIMCEMLPVPKVIQIVTTKGATHQNAVVRTASANLCNQIIERVGVDKIFSMNRDLRDKLLLTGANLLMEGSLDTRNHAKMFFKQLSYHPSYHKTLLDVIPSRIYRNIEKTLKNI